MKKLLTLLTISASLAILPSVATAKDKDKDKKDRYYEAEKKEWKVTRDDVRELREQYGRLVDFSRQEGSSRHIRHQVEEIGAGVERVSAQFERGEINHRDIRGRASQLDQVINNVRRQIEYERTRSNSSYYSRGRDRDDRYSR